MIAYLKGEIIEVYDDLMIVEVNQLGYNVKISTQTAREVSHISGEVKVYTYTYVREDTFCLYGFLKREELDIFKRLITVNGIGPKGALAILSTLTVEDLIVAIVSGDAKSIAKAPGVGAKTAERVIIDLRDKVDLIDTGNPLYVGITGNEKLTESSAQKEATEALTALGYSMSDALKAIKQIESLESMNTEAILKAALKKLSFM